MCGRYLFSNEDSSILLKIQHYYQKNLSVDLYDQISFNEVFPSQKTVVFILTDSNKLRPMIMKWGITLHNKQVINLRNENKIAQRYTPCLILSSGYYEWHKISKEKVLFTTDSGLLYIAGCYNSSNEFAIITEEANTFLSDFHSRVPFTLSHDNLINYCHREPVYSNQYQIVPTSQ